MRVFKETQRFVQSPMIIVMLIGILIAVGITVKEYTSEISEMTTIKFVLTIGLIILFTIPVFLIKLETKIDEIGIHYRFFPIHINNKIIRWAEIKTIYHREYSAISEYGGWGIKAGWRRKNGKAINIVGNKGIQIELINGKKILVGTQKEEDIKKVLSAYQHKIKEK